MFYSNDTDYNPFLSAERQLMELLECDDFKPFTPQQKTRPHTTDTVAQKPSPPQKKKAIKSADKITKPKINNPTQNNNNNNKRASVIDPPLEFEDKLSVLNDNFELIESFINDNFNDKIEEPEPFFLNANNKENGFNLKTILNERKYSDDLSSIDPELINENDNLSIPEHLKSGGYSPTSDNYSSDVTLQNDNENDLYSLQYDQKIASLEPYILPKTEIMKDLKRSVSLLEETSYVRDSSKELPKNKSPVQKSKGTKSAKPANKSTNSVNNSSFGAARGASLEKKKSSTSMKRSISMAEPVSKPRAFKNKEDVDNYFLGQDIKNGKLSPEKEVNLKCFLGYFSLFYSEKQLQKT